MHVFNFFVECRCTDASCPGVAVYSDSSRECQALASGVDSKHNDEDSEDDVAMVECDVCYQKRSRDDVEIVLRRAHQLLDQARGTQKQPQREPEDNNTNDDALLGGRMQRQQQQQDYNGNSRGTIADKKSAFELYSKAVPLLQQVLHPFNPEIMQALNDLISTCVGILLFCPYHYPLLSIFFD